MEERKMAKKGRSVATVFILTVILTLVFVGGTLFVLVDKFDILGTKTTQAATTLPEYVPMGFQAEAEHNQTVLAVIGDGEYEDNIVFLLMRFQPTENRIVIVPVSPRTVCQLGTEKYSAYEFFRRGGVISASKAISATMNVPIDRYVYMDNVCFSTAGDTIFGGVRYSVTQDVIYENSVGGEDVVIRAGTTVLTSNQARQLVANPTLDEAYRLSLTATLFTDMLNQAIGDRLYNSLDEYYGIVVNQTFTNISFRDYEYRKEAIENMIVPNTKPAVAVIPDGEWNGEEFTVSVEFRNELAEIFGVAPLEELAQ